MARRTQIRMNDMVTWVTNIKNTLSEEMAETIVNDLKTEGPYWTGQFEEAWRVELGNVDIPAIEEPILSFEERLAFGPANFTEPSEVPGGIPPAKGRKSITYSIGNITTYRDIAMDLDPDRLRIGDGTRQNTADPDWYLNYMQNSIYGVVEEVTGRVANQTDIKNYKGKL